MSTKTTFKRVALVAVAALGLGVLSVAPSQANVSGLALTVVNNGTASASASDSRTAAIVTVSGLLENAINDFKQFRTKIKKPMTDRAIKMLLTKLDTLASDDETKIKILENGFANLAVNWGKTRKARKEGKLADNKVIYSTAQNKIKVSWERPITISGIKAYSFHYCLLLRF